MINDCNWQIVPLGSLCSPRKEMVNPLESEDLPCVGLTHMDSGRNQIMRWGSIEDVRSTKSRFYKNDVLYGKLRPYLDKAALAEWTGVCSTDILVLQSNEENADPAFLSFLLHTQDFINHAISTTEGVNHPRTSWTSIERFTNPIPPLPEQRTIAAVLARVQVAIEMQRRIVDTLKELKAATMARLFREGTRGERLKQTEIGEIPEKWKVVRLGDHCTLKSGGTPSRKVSAYWGGLIPWVKTGEINYKVIWDTEERITQEGLDNSSAKVFPKGTLLMAMYGQGVTRGRVAILGVDSTTNQACVAFFPGERIETGYLYAYFCHSYERIRMEAHGANQQNLSADLIANFLIPVPLSKKEQMQIADIVGKLEIKIHIETQKKDRLHGIFSSLLHQLMTGKMRVTRQMIEEVRHVS